MTRLAAGFVAVSLREIGPRATLSALLTPIPLAKLNLKTTSSVRVGHNSLFYFYYFTVVAHWEALMAGNELAASFNWTDDQLTYLSFSRNDKPIAFKEHEIDLTFRPAAEWRN